MKFTLALSALALVSSVTAAVTPRANGQNGQQNKGQQGQQNKGGNNAGKQGGNNGANNGQNNNNGGGVNAGNAQTSTTLLPQVIANGFASNGQETPTAGQVASLTSTNNFINFCATTNLPITNGKQIKTGSCNPAPMGMIAPVTNMPAAKFVNPPNMGNIAANTKFTITMAIKNLQAGNFVNAQANYYSAPQQLNAQNTIIGHSHFVIEQLQSLGQTTPLDNTKFAFFQGVNTAADSKGNLNVDVTAGLPAGVYRLGSINAAANHQPVLVGVAQHGLLDDVVYFTVGGAGGNNGGNNGNNGNNGGNNGAQGGNNAAKGGNNAANNGQANNGQNKGQQGGNKFGKGGKRFAVERSHRLNRL